MSNIIPEETQYFIDEDGILNVICSGCGRTFTRFGKKSGQFSEDDMRDRKCYDCRHDVNKKITFNPNILDDLSRNEKLVLTADRTTWEGGNILRVIADSAKLNEKQAMKAIESLINRDFMTSYQSERPTQYFDEDGNVAQDVVKNTRFQLTYNGERIARVLETASMKIQS